MLKSLLIKIKEYLHLFFKYSFYQLLLILILIVIGFYILYSQNQIQNSNIETLKYTNISKVCINSFCKENIRSNEVIIDVLKNPINNHKIIRILILSKKK